MLFSILILNHSGSTVMADGSIIRGGNQGLHNFWHCIKRNWITVETCCYLYLLFYICRELHSEGPLPHELLLVTVNYCGVSLW